MCQVSASLGIETATHDNLSPTGNVSSCRHDSRVANLPTDIRCPVEQQFPDCPQTKNNSPK